MTNMKIINCEQCFNSLPVRAVGSHCGVMCPDCGWQPECSGEEIYNDDDDKNKIKESNVNS